MNQSMMKTNYNDLIILMHKVTTQYEIAVLFIK